MSTSIEIADDAVKRWTELLASAAPGSIQFTEYKEQLKESRAYRLSLESPPTTNTAAAPAGN
jgi:hypothetical protein